MKPGNQQEIKLNDLIGRMQRTRQRRKCKRLFEEALQIIGDDAHDGTISKLVRVAVREISKRYVYAQIRRLPESRARNKLIDWFSYYWSFEYPNLVMTWQVRQLCEELCESPLVTARQLNNQAILEIYPTKKIADLAMLRATENKPRAVWLLLDIIDHPKLKKKRDKLLNAALGCEDITAKQLMHIVIHFPHVREAAASIALANFDLSENQIALLKEFDETRDIAEVMTQ
jgi:hypothetical protein